MISQKLDDSWVPQAENLQGNGGNFGADQPIYPPPKKKKSGLIKGLLAVGLPS